MTTIRKTKRTILGVLCAALLLGLTGCGKNANETSISALNTVIKISAYGSNARKGISDASDIINALNTQLDTSSESSSISRVNAAGGKEIVVPGQFIDMYNAAQTAYTMTDGEFDITVFPFVEAWGFNSGNYHNPSKAEKHQDHLRRGLPRLCNGLCHQTAEGRRCGKCHYFHARHCSDHRSQTGRQSLVHSGG